MTLLDEAHILLVDHSGTVRPKFADALEETGASLTVVDRARDCLSAVEGNSVDAVVCEYDLPDIDAVRLLRSIRVSRPEVPFFVVAANGSEAVAGRAIAADTSGYLPADADPQTLVARVADALTTRRQDHSEEQLRYRNLMAVSPAPINLFDEDGESIWANQATLDLLEVADRSEIIGHSIFEFIHPDDHDRAHEEMAAVTSAEEPTGPTRMRLRLDDGTVKHILVSTAVGRFQGDAIGQAVVVDVTELVATQSELRSERAFIDQTIDALQDVFYVIDEKGNLIDWNDRAVEVTGYPPEEFPALELDDLFSPHDATRIREGIADVLEDREEHTIEVDLRTRTGRRIPFQFRGQPVETETGSVKMVGIGRDISEQKDRERQLRALDTWLRHNIRNDMNVVRGLAGLIAEEGDDETVDRAERITSITDHLIDQSDKVRNLVQVVTSSKDPVEYGLPRLLDRCVNRATDRFNEADVTLGSVADRMVTVIPELAEAVDELVENAVIHADRDEPHVELSATVTEGQAEITVADDGPGIPDAERAVLLAEREITQLEHGSGLGLLFVYWVARQSGGTVRFREREPRGSEVTVVVPTLVD